MANARLSTLDRDFYQLLIRQSDDRLRLLALTACQNAVQKIGLKYPVIDAALRMMTDQKPLDNATVAELRKLVSALVEIEREAIDRVKLGKTSALDGKLLTRQAQAANAVYLAASDDPLYAALEAVYEAYCATEDWPALKSALQAKLRD
jgi:hypothetical protein